MTHFEAIEGRLAEGYLLGELTAEQREQYEEHYFGCAECAEEVRWGAVFLANVRRISGEAFDIKNETF
jgi:anti-sigma factor RsiW